MSEQVLLINVRPLWARVPLLLLAVAALWVAWQGVRWGVGSTMAESAPASYASDPAAAFQSAEAAVRFAPDDPSTHLMLARLNRVSFDPELLPRALGEYDKAAALAPNNYLIWVEVGRARAASGDIEGGVAALRRAVELAPHYAEPRWHLGNALLRAGRAEEAFAELGRAAEIDPPKYRAQVFNLAWQVYAPDMSRVIAAAGRSPAARGQLVALLAGRGLLNEASAVWEGLGEGRRGQTEAAEALARAFYNKAQYRRAMQVLAESGAGDLGAGQVSNGSFESDIGAPSTQFFRWDVLPAPGAQMAIDARAASAGRRSLRVAFNAPTQVEFRHISQVVAVEPGARYRLTFSFKTDELRSAATLAVAVADAGPPEVTLVTSAPAPAGTADWQQVALDFAAGPKTEAVVIRVVRATCAEGSCPIYGKIWYDDFHLERAGGRPDAR